MLGKLFTAKQNKRKLLIDVKNWAHTDLLEPPAYLVQL